MFFTRFLIGKNTIWYILLLAFLCRLVVVLSIDPSGSDTVDGVDYHNHAISLLNGQGYPSHGSLPFIRPPLYPFLLSIVYFFFSHETYLTARLVNVVLDTTAMWVIYRIVLLIWNSTPTANLASIVYALNPFYIFFTARVRVEALFILLTATGLYFLIREYKARFPSLLNLLLIGVIFGLACLCRSNGTVFLILIPLWLAFCNLKSWKSSVGTSVGFVLGFVLVISPWSIRNYYHYGEFVFITDGLGYNIWVSNTDIKLGDLNARSYEEYLEADRQLWQRTAEVEKEIQSKTIRERDDHYFQLGVKYIKEDISKWLWLNSLKFAEFWSPAARFDMQGWKALFTLPFGLLMYFGMFFFVKSFFSEYFDKQIWLLIAILIVGSTMTGVLTWSSVRFRVPLVDAYIIPFGLFWLQRRFLEDLNGSE